MKKGARLWQQDILVSRHNACFFLRECERRKDLKFNRQTQLLMIRNDLGSTASVGDHLIRMFSHRQSLLEANEAANRIVEPTAVTWAAIISANANLGECNMALQLHQRILVSGTPLDKHVCLASLKACAMTLALSKGRSIHEQIIEYGFQSDVVLGSTLIDMYAKCGNLEKAWEVFQGLHNPDAVSWNIMIGGYLDNGEGLLALKCFGRMQLQGIKPQKATFLSILKACSLLGAIEHGFIIHDQIMENRLQRDISVGSALVDMYGKCGSMEQAQKLFDKLPNKNVITCGAIIAGYAQHGKLLSSLICLQEMKQEGVKPDEAIFTSVLVACSHEGFVNEGHWYFKFMTAYHGMTANISQCACMIGLLGRVGCLEEAEKFLLSTVKPDLIGWKSLLSACRMHRNIALGKQCFDHIVQLDNSCGAGYVLLSNIYANNLYPHDCLSKLQENVPMDEKI